MRVLALMLCVTVVAVAEDKKAPAMPTGNWTHEGDGATVRFRFKKNDKLTVVAKIGEASVTCDCTCTIAADGTIKAKITEVTAKGDFPELPKADVEMSFKFTVKGKTAKLSEFKSKDLEHARDIVEGEYESKVD